jgi:superfamily II DNA or RNA helicase
MNELRACQNNAIKAFKQHYYDNYEIDDDAPSNRGLFSMCCGSGKTRTIYEMIQYAKSKDDLFFVIMTSRINLIYQITNDFLEWNKINNFNDKIRILGGGGEKYNKITLNDKERVAETIKANVLLEKKPLIIITTYDSSGKIIEAIDGDNTMYPNVLFIDESHNTTGENDKNNQLLIKADTDKFGADKYVFMTATPVELITKNSNDKLQNKETVYSMKNKEIYGKILYQYSFKQGMNDGIIVPFDTVFLEDDKMNKAEKNELINEFKKLNKAEKNDSYYRTIIELYLAAFDTYKFNKLLVYCQNTVKMTRIEKIFNDALKSKNLKYSVGQISSELSKGKREEILNKFTKDPKSILLSVAIFDEGVDLPCIDAIAFFEERHTESRIIQNVGRCLRTHPNKKKAFVLLPCIIYELDGEDMDDVTKYSSKYKIIRNILDKMNAKIIHDPFCKKYVKGDRNNIIDDTYAENLDQLDLADDIKEVDNKNKIIPDTKFEEITTMSDLFTLRSTTLNVGNENYQFFKKMIEQYKINSLRGWAKICKKLNKEYMKHLDREYQKDWISWGDFLRNKTFTYQEVKTFLKDNELYGVFDTAKDWIEYFNDTIDKELNLKEKKNKNKYFIRNIVKIPNRPHDYYLSDWKGWNDFIGCTEKITQNLATNPTIEQNAVKNISNLINDDKQKIEKYKVSAFNEIKVSDEIHNSIREYIEQVCFKENKFTIKFQARMDKSGKPVGFYINCFLRGINKQPKPIIVIYPTDKKMKYSSRMINSEVKLNEEVIRDTEVFIVDENILKTLQDFIKYVRAVTRNENKPNEAVKNSEHVKPIEPSKQIKTNVVFDQLVQIVKNIEHVKPIEQVEHVEQIKPKGLSDMLKFRTIDDVERDRKNKNRRPQDKYKMR